MSSNDGTISRRGFFRIGSSAAVAGLVGRGGAAVEEKTATKTSRIVLVRDQKVIDEDGAIDGELLHGMLNRAVQTLFEEATPEAAWKRVISPDDVVGVKTNVWGHLPTPPALEEAIRAEVIGAGVKPDDVAVDDRGVRSNPVFQRATAIINTRPLRTHNWSGLGTCIKNMIMFVPRPPEYHADSCAPLGALWKLPELEGKVKLNILVMLTPQFHGVGPHSFSKEYTWPYGGLIVGVDPVAVDATGARILRAKRDLYFGEPSPISPPAHHIELAGSRYGLGVSDPDAIDLVRLGWEEEALI
ncbi:MAG: DUF362 domain-containing protein [Thermoanaerobaculales bacterium]|jgi:hypothetical protein|nr:DUF362 domain-containing protein [Thermoanaerobaculales bacterium]